MNASTLDSTALLVIARRDFRTFVQLAFPIINGGAQMEPSWHIDAMCHVLEEIYAGQILRQIINMPPRTLKSQIVSILWPAFLLGQNPALEIVVVSYADALAQQLSTDTRRLMLSPLYRKLFPDTVLEKQSSSHLVTTKGGTRYATTIAGSVTGFGADVTILDDPHNASEAYSEPARNAVKSYVRQSLLSRGNHPARSKFVLVMQRLHQDDLSGHFLASGGWQLLKLQAQATEAQTIPTGAGEHHQVRVGDLLLPNRLTAAFLKDQQRDMGSLEFQAQYQQEPAPAQGALIKRSWLVYGDPPARQGGRVTLSLDAAVKANPVNDFSVVTVWLEQNGKHYLRHVWRERVEFPALQQKMQVLRQQYAPDAILIEDSASGSALIQAMKRSGAPVIARSCKDSKESRLVSVSPYFEAGQVVLPKDAPFLAAYVTELLGFPGSRHDDQVDSTTQYLRWVHERPTGYLRVDWM